MTTYRCPVCQGCLASWLVRPEFTCHHCSWTLRSNAGRALAWAFGAAAAVELVMLASLWAVLPESVDAVVVWLSLGCAAAYGIGRLIFSRALVITPRHPQRVQPGAPIGTPPAVATGIRRKTA
jgi:hypothetical protein